MLKPPVFNLHFHQHCDALAREDHDLKQIIDDYGYPPLWSRAPDFKSLIHFILEQQVSLASAKAALDKLEQRLTVVAPEALLALTDEELKACYFSRQKIVYARGLAIAIVSGSFVMDELGELPDEEVRDRLKRLKGIGDWTADVFLMMALHRCDLFPLGDVALVKSIKNIKKLPADATKEEILDVAKRWQPYRSVAAYLLWHAYLSKRKKINSEL